MDLSQFSPTDKNEIFSVKKVKMLHKKQENTHTEAQGTLELKIKILNC